MSEDRLPGEIPPPAAEPPGAGSDSGPGRGIPDDEGEPIGIFPTWGWVYGTVICWTAVLVFLLYVFTITFDYGAR